MEEASIVDIQARMKDGKLTARRLVEMQADKVDARFKASGPIGPLHGIPVLLKDKVDTADMPTTAGSLSLKGYVPLADAQIVKKLRDAGAIILAKMNLHELAVWGETISSLGGQSFSCPWLWQTHSSG